MKLLKIYGIHLAFIVTGFLVLYVLQRLGVAHVSIGWLTVACMLYFTLVSGLLLFKEEYSRTMHYPVLLSIVCLGGLGGYYHYTSVKLDKLIETFASRGYGRVPDSVLLYNYTYYLDQPVVADNDQLVKWIRYADKQSVLFKLEPFFDAMQMEKYADYKVAYFDPRSEQIRQKAIIIALRVYLKQFGVYDQNRILSEPMSVATFNGILKDAKLPLHPILDTALTVRVNDSRYSGFNTRDELKMAIQKKEMWLSDDDLIDTKLKKGVPLYKWSPLFQNYNITPLK